MSIEKLSPFCPKDCVFLNEEDEVFHRGCGHLQDIVVNPPVPAETKTKPVRRVNIVGADPENYYAEETMYSGRKGIITVFKEGLRLIKNTSKRRV